MGLLTWAKRKLEENWPTSLFEAIMKVEGFSDVGWGEKSRSRRRTHFFTRRHATKWNGTKGMILQTGKSPNNFKVRVLNPKGISSRKRFF
jgi:hypothetical protein